MEQGVDYIIVGDGFAAMFIAHRLYQAGKTFRIFSAGREGASRVSAGVVNPVILKRFTTFPDAWEQIRCLIDTCGEIQAYTGENYLVPEPVCRIFHDENERQVWLKKSSDPVIGKFLSKDFKSFLHLENPFGYAEVLHSYRLDVAAFFTGLMAYFGTLGMVVNETLDYGLLKRNSYRDLAFNKVIFCEGVGILNNPFFKDIPVLPNKGHRMVLKLEKDLEVKSTVKKKYFLFPEGEGGYFFGANYDRFAENLEAEATQVDNLKKSLEEIYKFTYDISAVKTGMRATVADRKPILGRSIERDNFFIFNGLGARGVLNGCFYSKTMLEFMEAGVPLPKEIDLARFK